MARKQCIDTLVEVFEDTHRPGVGEPVPPALCKRRRRSEILRMGRISYERTIFYCPPAHREAAEMYLVFNTKEHHVMLNPDTSVRLDMGGPSWDPLIGCRSI